jgi:hypothetical protein
MFKLINDNNEKNGALFSTNNPSDSDAKHSLIGSIENGTGGGNNIGVKGQALNGSGTNIGIHGSASGASTNYAGYFGDGDVKIENDLNVLGSTNLINSAKVGSSSDPDASAIVDMESTTKGILIPRMTQDERLGINSPAEGLMVYQNNKTKGFYHYNGSDWIGGDDHIYWSPADNNSDGDNDALHSYDSELKIGIGTSNPDYKLEIEESGSGITDALALTNTSSGLNNGSSVSFKSTFSESKWTQAKISAYTLDPDIEQGAIKFEVMSSRHLGTMITPMLIKGDGKISFGHSNNSYTFPNSRGSNGQILSMSSNAGVLEWITPPTNTSPWTSSSENIYKETGMVGIGTNSPQNPLHITHSTNTSTFNASAALIDYNYSGSHDGIHANLNLNTSNTGSKNVHGIYAITTSSATNPSANTVGIAAYTSGSGSGSKRGIEASSVGINGDNFGGFFNASGAGNSFKNYGIYTTTTGNGTNYGIYATANGGSSNWSGYFAEGDVKIKDDLNLDKHLVFGNTGQVYMFTDGTSNSDKMILAHSTSHDNFGLQYKDVGDEFVFLSNGTPKVTIDLVTSFASDPNLEVHGNFKVNGEINSDKGGTANMIPIAYGTLDNGGSCSNCSDNISAITFNGGQNNWEININNETFDHENYTTLITPFTSSSGESSVVLPSVSSFNDNLIVNLYSIIAGHRIEGIGFSFVVYKK